MSKGVLVDTWYYTHKALEAPEAEDGDDAPVRAPRVAERKVEIKVRILKTTQETDSAPHTTASVSFEASCKEFDLRISGTDIEAIRAAVFGALDRELSIRWERYLLVRVERPHIFDGTGSGVQVAWSNVDKGTAWDGSELMREFTYGRVGRDIYKISPWPGVFTNKNGRVMACIPATDRNEDALQEFVARMDALRAKIADYLSPDNIAATLQNLSGMGFLPPPTTGIEGQEPSEPA